MNLETKVNEGGNVKQTAIDLGLAALTAIGAYNLAGSVASSFNLSDTQSFWETVGTMSTGTILGYKTRSIMNRIFHGNKRKIARQRIISEMSKDSDFLERQGIEKKKLGIGKSILKYALTIPAGGALGYYAGVMGMVPLCVYFGNQYSWSPDASLESGKIIGPLISAYALTEMAAKNQFKRMATTASALAGVAAGYFIDKELNLSVLDGELWPALGICAAGALIAGTIGNRIFKSARK